MVSGKKLEYRILIGEGIRCGKIIRNFINNDTNIAGNLKEIDSKTRT